MDRLSFGYGYTWNQITREKVFIFEPNYVLEKNLKKKSDVCSIR